MKKRSARLISASALYLCSINANAANILVNGDFELGNTGFTSSYSYSAGTILGAGQYTITDDPPSAHFGAPSYGDHTSGAGLMMMVNGATSPIPVWSQAVSLVPSTSYEFAGFLSSWQGGPAVLDVRLDGTSIGMFTASVSGVEDLGIWEGFAFSFNSGATSSATLEIIDLNLSASGNDFALDDLTLSQVPIPAAVWLFGSGLLGMIPIAARRKAA